MRSLTGRQLILSAVALPVAVAVFLIGKAAFDWKLRHLDDAAKPSPEKLEELHEHANAVQEQAERRPFNPLPYDLMEALSLPGQFTLYHKVADIPQAVRVAFAEAAGEESFSMADPGGKWEATDVFRDARLPRRRLSTLAIGAGWCLVFYEHGGIAETTNVAAFPMERVRDASAWHAYVEHSVANPMALARAIHEHTYREAPFF